MRIFCGCSLAGRTPRTPRLVLNRPNGKPPAAPMRHPWGPQESNFRCMRWNQTFHRVVMRWRSIPVVSSVVEELHTNSALRRGYEFDDHNCRFFRLTTPSWPSQYLVSQAYQLSLAVAVSLFKHHMQASAWKPTQAQIRPPQALLYPFLPLETSDASPRDQL
jgi:hypothetical protein